MTKNRVYGIVDISESCEIHWKQREQFTRELRKLDPGRYKVVVEKAKKSRTTQQNAYYWTLVSIISDHIGMDR